MESKKLRVGWFSFSCCEDSTIVFTEMLNDHYDEWKKIIDFVNIRVLKKASEMREMDIAFVEGAISSVRMEEELKVIRANCKRLIAIGACAVTGMPSAQRNNFDEKRKREVAPIAIAFGYREKVVPLHELVQVDDVVPGCPMTEAGFLKVLQKNVEELSHA